MRRAELVKIVILFGFVTFLFPDKSPGAEWYATQDGAIRIDAFDSFDGHIEFQTAFNQSGVCKDDESGLDKKGIDGAVAAAQDLLSRKYYYFHVVSEVKFIKDGIARFTLVLYASPKFYREPQIIPDEGVLLSKLKDLSMATQLRITHALKDQNGQPKEFTAQQLAAAIESAAGKQKFDLLRWVISNFFNKNEQLFMSCVPGATKLVDKAYAPDDREALKKALADAESTMRNIVRTSN